MPKAKPFSDDDEKTTIESQWEDEASTTVEQAEAGDKIRALGEPPKRKATSLGTNVTSTNGGQLDEPTVDDQHAPPALAALAPPSTTRLVITAGNDAGQELEIRPGKAYTIGRGLDNDVVLTDIAVSRKHFDLRNDDGSWVIVDRGSGNGTLVNGNIEDNPFMLANGDVIEIGNTSFRFDYPEGGVRRASSFDVEVDDEELSTVAGKPLNQKIVEMPTPEPMAALSRRPQTLPPPTPLRASNPSQPPPYPLSNATPASTLPMPQMANRPPIVGPNAPTMLGEPVKPLPALAQTMMPTAAPGAMHPMYSGYPQASEIPPHSVHAQMLVVQQQGKRPDGSTVHVPPTPFTGLPAAGSAPRYGVPQLSRRTKMIIGGASLTLFAAIVTIAILKSGGEPPKQDPKPVPIATPKPKASNPGKTISPIEAPKVTPIKQEPPKIAQTPTPIVPPTPTVPPPVPAPKPEPPKPEPPKPEPPKPDKIAVVAPKPEPPKPDKIAIVAPKPEPPKPPPVAPKPPKPEPPKPDKIVVAPKPPKPEPPAPKPPKQEPPKPDKIAVAPKPPKPPEPKPDPKPAKPKRVAAIDGARDRADALYHDKKFVEASNVLAAAAKQTTDASEAKDLRTRANQYATLGRQLNVALAPGGKAADQYQALRSAHNFDQNVGGAFETEINTKLAQVAPKAAIFYLTAKDFEHAHTAVIDSERAGSSGGNLSFARSQLETAAKDLYTQGMSELKTNPESAKEKFAKIKGIVDSKSQWYQKASKQLAGA